MLRTLHCMQYSMKVKTNHPLRIPRENLHHRTLAVVRRQLLEGRIATWALPPESAV